MLTGRGWSLLLVALLFLGLGIRLAQSEGYVLGLIGLSIFGWILYEWLMFTLWVRLALPNLRIQRRIVIDQRDTSMVWAGRSFQVILEIDAPNAMSIPYIVIDDLIPAEAEHLSGRSEGVFALDPGNLWQMEYQLSCSGPGLLRFEGQRIQLADLQGWFHFRTFLREPIEVPILPPLVDADGLARTDKRLNILPPPGVHRLRGPGSGSELHDLRDYRPGDPPKMIAWKASARKDKLIIKEFETEVPVRCTLLVDISQSVRIGPPGQNALAKMVTIAAAIAQAASANRDLVGLTLFDEQSTQVMRPARGSRHLVELLNRLARSAALPAVAARGDVEPLLRLSLSLANDVYPDLMRASVNRLTWRMFWRPLLDSERGWRVIALMFVPLLAYFSWYRDLLANIAAMILPSGKGRGLLFLLLIVLPTLIGLLFWFFYGVRGYFDTTTIARRKKVAAVVAQSLQLPADAISRMLVDDVYLSEQLQRFLAKHHTPYPIALYDGHGEYQFRSSSKIPIVAAALANAVGRGRDNEMFILIVDLMELDTEREPLLNAVRVALARHHQVLIVCPWLPQMPSPEEFIPPDPVTLEPPQNVVELEDFLRNQEIARYHRAYESIRHDFGRLGVTVLRVNEGDPVRATLDRLERLRMAGIRR